jgi:mannose-1-phosphate guanylyltransferase
MKALLLAAGFGTRLGQITKLVPKALIKVRDKPILGFCLDQLSDAGVTEVIINTHYLAPQVEEFISDYSCNLDIELSHEEILLGTAGTLKKHYKFLSSDDFIVMHADNYFADSIHNFVKDHRSRPVGKFGSLGTFETNDPSSCGVLVLNPDKTILEFHEKVDNPPSKIANSAIYAFTPEIGKSLFDLTPDQNDLSRHLVPKIMTDLYTHKFDGLFVDIGTPQGLQLANDYNGELNRSTTC